MILAKTTSLREFQESILLKLKEAALHGGEASTSRLGVTVGGKNLLISLSDVREVLPMPQVQPVPLTQPWFLGVANVRGNLYNVSDLAFFIGLPLSQKTGSNRIVLLNSEATTQAALMIESLVGLRATEAMQAKTATDTAVNEDHAFLSRQSYMDVDGNEWFELNIASLVQDAAFIQPGLV